MLAMSLSLSSTICKPSSSPFTTQHSKVRIRSTQLHHQCYYTKTRCQVNLNESNSYYDEKTGKKLDASSSSSSSSSSSRLGIGSPVIITEAPKMIKTAASVPCLRVNADLVKPGDVGRIVSRKPMDVWAIRLTIGTYLIDRKYFKPLELDESN